MALIILKYVSSKPTFLRIFFLSLMDVEFDFLRFNFIFIVIRT